MWFVILSVICSVTVGIFLKVAKRFQLNIFQIITFNHFSALLITYLTYQPELTFQEKTIPYLHWKRKRLNTLLNLLLSFFDNLYRLLLNPAFSLLVETSTNNFHP